MKPQEVQLSHWIFRGRCRNFDPELWHPGTPSHAAAKANTAKLICLDCPVISSCRDYVDRLEATCGREHMHGIWAGEDADERERRRDTGKVASREDRRAVIMNALIHSAGRQQAAAIDEWARSA